jgi:predicted CXXCH cytochrome family protein
MVKRPALALVGGAVWLLLAAAPVLADNGPHRQGASSTSDACAGCHRTHTAQSAKLLGVTAQTALCYTCHGTTGTGATTDVQDGVQYAPASTAQITSVTRTGSGTTFAGALRGGGFSQAVIDTGLAGTGSTGANLGKIGTLAAFAPTTSTHDIGTTGTAWGLGNISATANAGTSVTLSCGSCHDTHGNGKYRILKPTPENAYTGAYTGITPSATTMSNVSIADTTNAASGYVYTTSDYWHPEDASTGNTYIASVSGWCTSCHTRYLAGAGAGSTSSGDAVFTYRHRSNGSQYADSVNGAAPTCIQCHVAHGSNATTGINGAAVPMPGGTTAGRDSSLLRINNRGVCEKCHRP